MIDPIGARDPSSMPVFPPGCSTGCTPCSLTPGTVSLPPTPPPCTLLTIYPGDSEARGDHHHHESKAGAVVIQKDQPVHTALEHKAQRRASKPQSPLL